MSEFLLKMSPALKYTSLHLCTVQDPATILLIASTTVSAVSSISAGNAQAASYKAQAQASEYNAQMQERNAARTAQEYSIREDNMRRQQAKFLGSQAAALAQSETGLGTGSNLDVIDEDTQSAELDALTLRYEGQQERAGLLSEANMSRYDASVSRMNGRSARQAGYLGALGNVLRGTGQYYSSASKAAALKTPATAPVTTPGKLPWRY